MLGAVELVTPGWRSLTGAEARSVGRVRFQDPRVCQVAAADVPKDPTDGPGADSWGHFGMELAFELEPLPARSQYVAAFLLVRFADPRVAALDLLATTPNPATVAAVSAMRGAFGWLLGDPEGTSPISLTCKTRALVRAPLGAGTFSGALRLDASITRAGLTGSKREHARTAHLTAFELRTPEGWADINANAAVRLNMAGKANVRRPAVRLCVAADTESYSRFRSTEAARAQQRLVDVLASARRHAGLDDEEVDLQQSGDGQFAILPAGLDESAVIPKLVEGMRVALAETNSDLSDRARLRLRVALHRGHVAPGMNGWVGGATIAVHRLLDSDVLRTALAQAREADFALIASDVLYQDVIAHRYGLLDPDEFVEVKATLPAKNFAERAWVHVPRM